MKKIDKLLLKSYIGPLVLTFCIAIFILLMQFIWKYIDELVGKGLDFWIIFKFIFYSCWTFVPMALPLAVLLSSLMLFGNLGEHYELVALKSAGIPLRRAMKPLVFICVGVCCVAFYFANYALPSAYLNFRKVHYEIRTKKPAVNIQEGIYYSDIDGYVIRIGEKTEDGSKLKNIQIYDHSERLGNTRVTMSNWGSMQTTPDGKYLIFNLYDGCSYGEDVTEQASSNRSSSESAAYPFSRIKFDTQVLVFNLNSFQLQSTDENMFSRHQKTLGLKSLQKEIDTLVWKKDMRLMEIIGSLSGRNYYLENFIGRDSIEAKKAMAMLSNSGKILPDPSPAELTTAASTASALVDDMKYYKEDINYQKERVNLYDVEKYKKFSLSVACLILFFIGAPLGSIIRKGGMGMPVVVSVLLFITYHIISVMGEKAAIEGSLTCAEGIWLAPLIFLPFGIFLTLKANMDSSLLDVNLWKRFFLKRERRG